MAENDVQPSVGDDLVLARAFAEFARERRVLWIGRLTEGAEELAEEARSVRLLGAPGDIASTMPAALRITAYRPGRLAFRPGSFDLAVVPDATWLGEEAPDRLAELATIVGDGLLVFSCDGPTEDSYTRLRLLVERAKIERARILGRTRFEGAAFAALDREPSDVVVDGELVGRRSVERYVVIAGPRAEEVPALSLVGVPAVRKSAPPPALEDMLAERSGEAARLRAEIEEARERASSLAETLRVETERFGAEVGRLRAEGRDPADEALERDCAALEAKLAEQARRLLELEAELERRSTLVRDMVEAPHRTGADAPEELVARLVASEATVVAARFENDELRAEILARREDGSPAAWDDERAALVGTVRGLRARLAEAEELQGLLDARLTLAHLDLEASRERERRSLRETEELRERFELELVRTRGLSPTPPAEDFEAARGEIAGLRLRLADREAALAALREGTSTPARDEAAVAELRAQADELRAASGVREALVTRLQLDLARAERSGEDSSRQLAGAKAESERLRGALVAASEAVDAREALVARVADLETVATSARTLERERDRALEALRDARATLAAIDFSAAPRPAGAAITAAGIDAPREEPGDRPSAAALARELADRDTLLRSLTAQVEERNDRIRALERRLAGASVVTSEDTSALTQEIMELQERVVRLSEQLAQEREARRAVESQPPPRPGPPENEVVDLRRAIDERDAVLQRTTRRVGVLEGDLQATREAVDHVREGLEALIGDSAVPMDLADRLGKLLETLP